MKCPKCSSEIKEKDVFCPVCGQNLKENKIHKKEDKKKNNTKVIAAIVVIVIIAIAGVALMTSHASYTKAVSCNGNTFYIPESFNEDSALSNSAHNTYVFENSDSFIVIFVSPEGNVSLDNMLNSLKSLGLSNVEQTTIGGYSGYSYSYADTDLNADLNSFVYKDGSKIVDISVSPALGGDISKIITGE